MVSFTTRDCLPDPCQEDIEDNGGPAHAAEESQGNENHGPRNNPVDILGEEDLVRRRITTVVRRGDHTESQIGSHGEVRDGSDQQSDGEEVVEDALIVARLEAEEEVDELRGWLAG